MPPCDLETARWFSEHVQPHEAMLRAWLARDFGPRLAIDDGVQEAYTRGADPVVCRPSRHPP